MTAKYETPYEYPLIVPLKGVDGEITHLSLREPSLAEMEKLANDTKSHGGVKAFSLLIDGQSKVTMPVLKTLGARDFMAVQAYYDYFLSPPPATTSTD